MRNILRNKTSLIRRIFFYIIVLSVFSASQGYCEKLNNTEIPLVVVNGDTITSKNIDRMVIKTHKNLEMSDKQSFDYNKLLTKSINDLLILQEAYALGLDENEDVLKTLDEKRKELIRKLYLSHAFKPNIIVTDKEISDFFDENLKRYQFRTISLATMDEANDVYKLLKQGQPFDSLATELSLDYRRLKNGLHMVTFKMNVEKLLLKKAERMQVGEFSKPFLYKKYYTILKLEKKMDADKSKFDVFKDKIKDRLIEERKEIAWYKFMDELHSKYPITVDSAVIDDIKADKADVLRMKFRQGTDRPVLAINDEYFISDNQLRNEISHNIMNAGTTPFNIILVNSINKKQEELLSIYSAVQNGYWDSTRVVDWYYNELDSSMIELYLKEMIVSKISFNKAEFENYYNENKENFRNQDQFLLEQMKIADNDKSHDAALALKEGAQWSYIFNEYNCVKDVPDDQTKWVSLENYPPEVKKELESLHVGQTSSSFQTAEGFVIFQIKDRKQGGYKSIDEVDMQIRKVMFQKKFNELMDAHLNSLKNKSKIVYFDKEISKYFGKEN